MEYFKALSTSSSLNMGSNLDKVKVSVSLLTFTRMSGLGCVKIIIAGTGSALNPFRGQSSVIVDGGGTIVTVDLGCQAPNVAEKLEVKLDEAQAHIVTHEHYDHICGLPMVAFVKTFRSALPELKVYAPPTASEYLKKLLQLTAGSWKIGFNVEPVKVGGRVRVGDLEFQFIEAVHTVEALSVIIKHRDLKIVVSGDTRPTSAFKKEAEKADLAIHEATFPSRMAVEAASAGHSTVSEALSQLENSNLGILYHLTRESEEEALTVLRGHGRIIVAGDGAVLRLC
ncbi:MAG: MBL fold metallo-hydrolase [Thermoprotei archaeon]|nr:MBL fold metallo-hydrolase [Thermoprotei archaeon]